MSSRSLPRELFETLVIAVVCAVFVRTFLVQVFRIPSSSMEESLLVGDQVVVNRLVYAHLEAGRRSRILPMREVRRGDVLVFRWPPERARSREVPREIIKRCVGLPGETVEIADNRVFIDGRAVAEPYVHFTEPWRSGSFGPYRVPEASYFCLGDHRDRSMDSRTLGPVPARLVRARAWFIYWSFGPETSQEQGEWSMIDLLSGRSRWGRFPRWVR